MAPDESGPLVEGLSRRAFLARVGAIAAAGAVAAYLPAWADRPHLLALLRRPPRPLGVLTIDWGDRLAPVPFYDDGRPARAARPAADAALAPGEQSAGLAGGWHHVEVTFHDWVTYSCRVWAETLAAFSPFALPVHVPFPDAPPPPPRLAAAIAAYGDVPGPEWLEDGRMGGVWLRSAWMYGPDPSGPAGAIARAEPAAAAYERAFGSRAPRQRGSA